MDTAGVAKRAALVTPGDGYVAGDGTEDKFFKETFPIAGTIRNLRWGLAVAPGVGKSRTLTVYVNGSATIITSQISGTDTVGSDLTHEVSVNAGDYIILHFENAGTPAACSQCYWGLEFDSGTEGSILIGCKGNATDLTATEYSSLAGSRGTWSTAEADHQQLVAAPGNLRAVMRNRSVYQLGRSSMPLARPL